MINPAAWTSIIKHKASLVALHSVTENVDQLVSACQVTSVLCPGKISEIWSKFKWNEVNLLRKEGMDLDTGSKWIITTSFLFLVTSIFCNKLRSWPYFVRQCISWFGTEQIQLPWMTLVTVMITETSDQLVWLEMVDPQVRRWRGWWWIM